MAKTYSTVEVARMLDVTSDTLHRWIREKKVPAPEAQSLGPFRVRLWTIEDVEIVRKYKAQYYWGKGGRKKRKKRAK
jgi:DNA-binding transcriptional MerR regulator